MDDATTDAGRIGTVVEIMCHGHVVKAKVLGVKQTYAGSPAGDPARFEYECEFIAHHRSGATRLCLDFGQDWYIDAGETFMAGETQIERAAEWLAKDTAEQVAEQVAEQRDDAAAEEASELRMDFPASFRA